MKITPEALFLTGVVLMILLAIVGSIFLILNARRTEKAADEITQAQERIELTAEKIESLRKRIHREVSVRRSRNTRDSEEEDSA